MGFVKSTQGVMKISEFMYISSKVPLPFMMVLSMHLTLVFLREIGTYFGYNIVREIGIFGKQTSAFIQSVVMSTVRPVGCVSVLQYLVKLVKRTLVFSSSVKPEILTFMPLSPFYRVAFAIGIVSKVGFHPDYGGTLNWRRFRSCDESVSFNFQSNLQFYM